MNQIETEKEPELGCQHSNETQGDSRDRQTFRRPRISTGSQPLEKRLKPNEENKVLLILESSADGKTILKWPKDKILHDQQKLANIIIDGLVENSSTYVFFK